MGLIRDQVDYAGFTTLGPRGQASPPSLFGEKLDRYSNLPLDVYIPNLRFGL
jgi:hypothetical protein